MERRTVFLMVGLLVAVASLGGAFCVWAFGPDQLEEKLEQVQPGMTIDEVEAILGKPGFHAPYLDFGVSKAGWSSERAIITAVYTNRGRLDHKLVERRPLWDRIREKLPW
jgi:hypothetical protein